MLAFAVLILLPAILVVIVLLALRSETGTTWVIDQVPGLTVTDGQGSLFGQWHAQTLEWRGYGVNVEVDSPFIEWSPSCLFNKELCLDTLHAQRLVVNVQPSSTGKADGSDLTLPTIDLPLGVRISDVSVGPFVFNGSQIWDRLEFAAVGSGADWMLERGFYELDAYSVTVSGRVATRRDWPVDLNVQASLPPPSGDEWLLDVNLSGSVRDLTLAGRSNGYLDAGLTGNVSPLDRALPAKLKITSRSFLALETLPETLVLRDWFLEANGSLESGFETRGRAVLPGTEGPINLLLRGHVGTEAARDIELELSTQKPEQTGKVRVAGKVNWQGGLNAEADVSLTKFPWFSLLPGVSEPPVILNSLDGSVSWGDGQYHARLKAAVDGPQGEATLSSVVDGDLSATTLTDLKVTTGAGSLAGGGALDFSGPLSWEAALKLDNFNPGYWLPMLEASLSGDVETRGALREGEIPDMTARWDLAGQWKSKPASAVGTLNTASGAWEVSGLAVAVGENSLEGSGVWGEALDGNLVLSLPAPGEILAGLKGRMTAKLNIAGTPDDPQGDLTFSAQELAWQDTVTLASLDLDASLAPGFRLRSHAEIGGIEAGGQRLESVTLDAAGIQDDHRLTLTANHEDADLRLVFGGGFDDSWTAWQGALASGLIEIPEQDQSWRLQSPAKLAYRKNGQLTFDAHCWSWQESSFCAEDQVLLPTPRIAYRINNFPAAALDPLMPEALRWRAQLNGSIDVTMAAEGPRGQVRMDAGKGEFRVLLNEEWESLQHEIFTVGLNLQPEKAELDIRLSGPELGELTVNTAVDPATPERTVTGQFSLQGLDIALAGIFTGLERVSGKVKGQGKLSGPLMKPMVKGEITLSNARLVDPRLPVPLDDVFLSLDLNGYSADINGRIKSNARSETIVGGTLDWENRPEGELTIRGKRVPFSLEPYARLEVEPDLTIAFRQGELSVAGQVAVPRGSIEIKGLPEQAVSVSDDEVIVGVEPQEPVIRSLKMDVTVVVGEDRVTFAAFGVKGDLEGSLRIGNDMDTRGTLQLVNGQYDAYGQELELRRARILFVGNLTQPYLDIEAIRTVGSVVAGIRLSGPVQSPATEVFSTPDMSQTDALSYVILGRPAQSRGEEGQMGQAALSLGLTQASKVTGKIGEEFGVRDLMLEAEGSGEQTSIVASGYLTEELSVRYGVGIFEPITTVALRYDLGRYFYLEAASGLAASLDIFYTRDF
ncbi:translocation/assembly module TamB [Marinobacter sediminum]|nr:translocation/assembly module TamB [Marinobacter sediminum]